MTNSPTTNPTTRPMAGPPRRSRKAQAPLMLLAALSLLAGLWAGLNRLGWIIPPLPGTITALLPL